MFDAHKIYWAHLAKGYPVFVGDDVYNITYIEGMNMDGTPNHHIPNQWDDIRTVWQVDKDGNTKLLGAWEATTRASLYWTKHPMNPEGAFMIALGPQTCWTMGTYHDMPALIQTKPIRGTRDYNQDFDRKGDEQWAPGLYGVHHHWGYNYPHDDLGRSSAGCQVGRMKDGHLEFISLLKQDRRYKEDHEFIFTSTVLEANDVLNATGPSVSSKSPTAGIVVGAGALGSVIMYLGTWDHMLYLIASVAFLGLLGGILWKVYHKQPSDNVGGV